MPCRTFKVFFLEILQKLGRSKTQVTYKISLMLKTSFLTIGDPEQLCIKSIKVGGLTDLYGCFKILIKFINYDLFFKLID